MTTATIYALCDSRVADPAACVRYVGQTRIPLAQRLKRHWVTALAGAKEHRAAWMRSVIAGGGDVLITALECVPYTEADTAETAHIARLRASGCDLTNRTDGGRGKRGWEVSSESRRKMSEAASRRIASLETRQKMSAAIAASPLHRQHLERLHQKNTGSRRSAEQRARISQSLVGEKNGQNVLTWDDVASIRARYAAGERQSHLARAFQCSPATICAVVHKRRWVAA